MKQHHYNVIKEIGDETEFNANELLKSYYDKTEWISKKHPLSPYDFICYDKDKKIVIDVKSCLNGKIYVSKGKKERILSHKYGEFYYLLRIKKLSFHLIHSEELLNGNSEYIIISNKKNIFRTRVNGATIKPITLNIKDTIWKDFIELIPDIRTKNGTIVELIEKFIEEHEQEVST